MLQRISTHEAELGMFVVRLDGNWFKHPFWKRKFLLDNYHDLVRLQTSPVDTLLIDLNRGNGVSTSKSKKHRGEGNLVGSAASRVVTSCGTGQVQRGPPSRDAREIAAAKKLVTRADRIVSQVFLKARLGQAVNLADVEPVVDEVFDFISRNQFVLSGLLRCKQGKAEVYRHALSISALMVALARQLKMSPEQIK